MHKTLVGPAFLLAAFTSVVTAAPGSVPASLKTLESVLKDVDLPSGGSGSGMQPLLSAVAAADALLRSLDPNGLSGALSKPLEENQAAGETGLLLGRKDGYAVVSGVLPGSPAASTQLREYDRLISIGDTQVKASDRLDVLEHLLRGEVDSKTTVRVLRRDGAATLEVELNRTKLRSSIQVRTLPGGVGYVRIGRLSPVSLAEYRLHVGKLAKEKLIGIVLDLRGSQGGSPEDAAALTAPFLGSAKLGSVYASGGGEKPLAGSGKKVLQGHLVVLVGPATTGASEIAAAAFQAQRRAVLLGEATQGRAPGYRHVERAGVFLTVPQSVFRLQTGTMVSGRGISPDILVATEAVHSSHASHLAGQRDAFAEGKKWEPPKEKTETDKELENALEGEDGAKPKKKEEPKPDSDEEKVDASEAPRDPFHDYPLVKRYDPRLVRAVHLLMAANIFYDQAN